MIEFYLNDNVQHLMKNVTKNWLLSIRETNPAILDMLRDKSLKPARFLNPWSGEFPGKYLTGCAKIYALTRSEKLCGYVKSFIGELLCYQEVNGYMGAFDSDHQLTGTAEAVRDVFRDNTVDTYCTWDCWAHYHMMVGLMLWHDILSDDALMIAIDKIAQLFISKFYNENENESGQKITDTGSSEMNLAVYHSFAMLYNRTKRREYLDFALKIEEDTRDERAGNYLEYALSGTEFYQCPKPRWESMHVIMGYAEMYRATGREEYLNAVRQIVYSILKSDVHNTGAFSTDEQAIGHPYKNSSIETCCVVAYNALVCQLYRLEPEKSAALGDFLEISLYNAVMGCFSKTGRWSTYDTPMDGYKRANYHSIVFQSRPGSPDLNCCSVNAHRGLGEMCEWLVYENPVRSITYLNYYGACEVDTGNLCLKIKGNYPYHNKIRIKVKSNPAGHALALRIPAWSKNTVVTLDGEGVFAPCGEYLILDHIHKDSKINIIFDFTPYFTQGGGDYANKMSVYRGPILLGFDNAENRDIDFMNIPAINQSEIFNAAAVYDEKTEKLSLILKNKIVLNDFYSLGQSGSAYRTWLEIL